MAAVKKEFIMLDGKKTELKTMWRSEVLYTKKLYLIAGSKLARLLLKTSITANQVTYLRFIIGIISIALFIHPLFLIPLNYWFLLTGMALFQVSMLFDCADGTIARTRGSAGNYGKFIELNIDRAVEFLIFLAVVYVAFVQTLNPMVWLIGTLAIGLESLIVTHKFGLRFLYPPAKSLRKTVKKRGRLLGALTYTSFTRHILMIFFVIFNQLFWYLVVIAAYYFVFYVAMLGFAGRKLKIADAKL